MQPKKANSKSAQDFVQSVSGGPSGAPSATPQVAQPIPPAKPSGFAAFKKRMSAIVGLIFVVYILLAVFTSLDNIRVCWTPADLYTEVITVIKANPKKLPASYPAEPAELKGLVDPRLYPAFYLIERDAQFNYLAKLVYKYRIPISVVENISCNGGRACYKNTHGNCTMADPGYVQVSSDLLKAATNNLAAIVLHELTHAQNKLEKPEYYCRDNFYLSNEFLAYKNEVIFKKQYVRFGWDDCFDNKGVFHPYPLYVNTKRNYQNLTDDMKLKAPNNIMETVFAFMFTN